MQFVVGCEGTVLGEGLHIVTEWITMHVLIDIEALLKFDGNLSQIVDGSGIATFAQTLGGEDVAVLPRLLSQRSNSSKGW